MPRTLPWLAQAKTVRPQHSSSSPAPKRKRAATPTSDPDLVDSDLNTTGVGTLTPERRKVRKPGRSPSTSPPPAPPDVEYMREGFTQDDIWMMVEDEFLSTAQMFTQHIHHAEYVRLKKLAKSRGQSTLQALDRPTDGRTAQSTATKLRLEAEEKARKAKAGVKAMIGGGESDEEEEDDYMLDPQLAGLMTASQRSAHDLTGLAKAKANTRAAAGFERSPQKKRTISHDHFIQAGSTRRAKGRQKQPAASESGESSEDDDDLDARPSRPAGIKRPPPSEQPRCGFFKRFADASQGSKTLQEPLKPALSGSSKPSATGERSRLSKLPRPPAEPAEEDDFTFSASAKSQATMDFQAKRQTAKAAKEAKEHQRVPLRDKSSVIEVPTFLI